MHDAITVGVPVLAILFGILSNQRGIERLDNGVNGRIDKLEARFDARFNALDARIYRIHADSAQFYKILGEHGARLDNLEKRA